MSTTVIARPRRAAAVTADYRVRYNERAKEERESLKRRREEKASARKKKRTMTNAPPPSPPLSESPQSTSSGELVQLVSPPPEESASWSDMEMATEEHTPPPAETPAARGNVQTLPQPELSLELWDLILKDFYPSQLTVLAQVSRPFYDIVAWLPIWRRVCENGGLGEPLSRGRKGTYYKLARFESARICEQCYKKCKPSGSQAALPVHMPSEGGNINLCRTCRRAYYLAHPEPPIIIEQNTQPDANGYIQRARITKGTGIDHFKLTEGDLNQLAYTPVRNPYYRHAAPMRLYDRQQVHEYARRVHGGEVGIEAMRDRTRRHRARLQHRREERAEALRQQRAARREALDNHFQQLGLDQTLVQWDVARYVNEESTSIEACAELARVRQQRRDELRNEMTFQGHALDERSPIYEAYVMHGRPSRQHAITKLVEEIMARRAREQRRAELEVALGQKGLAIDARSTLCQNYISSGTGTVDHIVEVLLELDWFVREADYMRNRGSVLDWSFQQDSFKNKHPLGKWKALNGYLTKRLENHIWNDIEQDQDTTARPPLTLWPQIRLMMPDIWTKQANDYVATTYFANLDNFTKAVREDPEIYVKTITDQFLIKAMNDALQPSYASSQRSSPKLSSTSFASAMQEALGEEKFQRFLESARKTLMDEIMGRYLKGAASQLPGAMQEFIESTRMGATLTVQRYNEIKQTFIQEKIPEIANETDIHPTYLIALLNSLSSSVGYIRCYRC
ncbi:hypothetical protein BJV82DRAFT_591604 [Fennellomyces sp. T-0311]|nr:hypothetical protein BJV82DRAFT_591604 [Fennellomyces sp. T-0311]